jgi:hypothetical protein
MTCKEAGFWQDSAPESQSSLVSRLMTPASDLVSLTPLPLHTNQPSILQRQCAQMFPEEFGNVTAPIPAIGQTNRQYDGWNVDIPNLFFANGKSMMLSSFFFHR